MKIQIINGPNLNLLGTREPGIYGNSTFDDYLKTLRAQYPHVQIDYYQSNIEGCLIDKMQEVGFDYDGIILNAGAYTHTKDSATGLHPFAQGSRYRGAYKQCAQARGVPS